MRDASSEHSTLSQRSMTCQSDVALNDFAASMLLGTHLGLTGSSLMPLAARATHLHSTNFPLLSPLPVPCGMQTRGSPSSTCIVY